MAHALLVTPERLRQHASELPNALIPTAVSDAGVERAAFEGAYLEAMCALYRGAKNLPASCP